MKQTVVWLRQDLRLADNPALQAALAESPSPVLLYILDDGLPEQEQPGGASRWWLHHSLDALGRDIAGRGGELLLRRGAVHDILSELLNADGIATLHVNQVIEPAARKRDEVLFKWLRGENVEVHEHVGSLLFPPGSIRNKSGGWYKVFTPFWRSGCLPQSGSLPAVEAPPEKFKAAKPFASERLAAWALLPEDPDWAGGFGDWRPGEAGAMAALTRWAAAPVSDYARLRDNPAEQGTSRLSPALHFGELAPWRVWHAVREKWPMDKAEPFLRQLGWREFSSHLLWHFPQLPRDNWKSEFDHFEWHDNDALLRAWQQGRTGYPFVDAGMRQLWETGWMHNRVRMVVASFLVKHLGQHWRRGERWFWDTLVDADAANNAAGWQWVAGSGADAAPYFRVFNPIRQGERFDPKGDYVRRFVPELAKLPDKHLHAPWEADSDTLEQAGVVLGDTYPRPIVDHADARAGALAAYQRMRADA